MAEKKNPTAWLIDRIETLKKLDNESSKAIDELNSIVAKNIDLINSKKDLVTTEQNSYDRNVSSFFGLSVSFIVGGLLQSIPDPLDSIGVKICFVLSIFFSLTTILLIFLEYIDVSKFFHAWSEKYKEVTDFINSTEWNSPNEMIIEYNKMQSEIKGFSSKRFFYAELVTLLAAFITLIIWIILKIS